MYLNSSNSNDLINYIVEQSPKISDVVFIMIGEKNYKSSEVQILIKELNKKSINFFGGIFTGLIFGEHKYDEGAIVKILPAAIKPVLIRGLNTKEFEIPDINVDEYSFRDFSAIVVVDGLTSNISLFLAKLFKRYGNSINYLGGGAGSLSLVQNPCVFTRDGIFQDAAIFALIKLESHIGVRHGWNKIEGPFIATKTDKNIVKELNWQNAFDVYRKVVEKSSGKQFNSENFFDIAKGYPFGIAKEGMEYVVRDPIGINEDGELICVGEVPENTVLDILKGEPDSLLDAAENATKDCLSTSKMKNHALVFDCISRVLFLEDNFSKELGMVQKTLNTTEGDVQGEGVLTLGEIALHGKGYLEFFNKTIVTGIFYE